jgi:CAAX protease family protein
MKRLLRRYPVGSFYGTVVVLAWAIFGVVVGPKLGRGRPMEAIDAFKMFPLLVLSVALCGLYWAHVTGENGARMLLARVRRWRVGARWYFAAVGIPPVMVLGTLMVLGARSSRFHPGFFGWGVLFGLVPGLLEEVGWSGYLYPQLRRRFSPLAGGLILGVLWACWHLPVVDFLGAAGPHRAYFVPFFLAFAAVLTAMRVLMVWIYERTGSVLLMQLMHASSTGSLVLFGPPHVTSRDEALWYGAYAVALWILATLVTAGAGRSVRTR